MKQLAEIRSQVAEAVKKSESQDDEVCHLNHETEKLEALAEQLRNGVDSIVNDYNGQFESLLDLVKTNN